MPQLEDVRRLGAVSHMGFVNTWECDENAHMNVQFYLKRFAEAAEVLGVKHGFSRASAHLPPVRHVRYHRELRFNASTLVVSARICDGEHQGQLAHMMFDANTGVLAATALDRLDEELPASLPELPTEMLVDALPRGLPPGKTEPISREHLIRHNAIITQQRIVQPMECDRHSNLTTQSHISHFTDGAPMIWDHAGLTTDWLSKNGYGRVAVEMKLTSLQPIPVGTPTCQWSFVETVGSKTFSLRHQIETLDTGVPLATGEVVGLVMDLATRKAVPMPDFMTDKR